MGINLKGKVALITGASRGIGRAIALELSKAGAEVIINYKEDQKGAEETLKSIRNYGGYGIIYKCDICNYKCCIDMTESVIKRFGRIDILVNNAGISKIGLFTDMTEKDFDEIIDVNLKGTLNCSHSVLKYMLNNKSGSIVNVSSMWGNYGGACEVIYSASKGAINAFTKALAKEVAPSNIRVNGVAPGVINTEMNKWLSRDEITSLENEIPLCRFGETCEVAKVVTFLASDESSYINSQIINVDGGIY